MSSIHKINVYRTPLYIFLHKQHCENSWISLVPNTDHCVKMRNKTTPSHYDLHLMTGLFDSLLCFIDINNHEAHRKQLTDGWFHGHKDVQWKGDKQTVIRHRSKLDHVTLHDKRVGVTVLHCNPKDVTKHWKMNIKWSDPFPRTGFTGASRPELRAMLLVNIPLYTSTFHRFSFILESAEWARCWILTSC